MQPVERYDRLVKLEKDCLVSRGARSIMARLVRFGLGLAHKNGIEGERMSGLEGQANLAQASERPLGRTWNPGVPKSAGPGRKARPSLSRG